MSVTRHEKKHLLKEDEPIDKIGKAASWVNDNWEECVLGERKQYGSCGLWTVLKKRKGIDKQVSFIHSPARTIQAVASSIGEGPTAPLFNLNFMQAEHKQIISQIASSSMP